MAASYDSLTQSYYPVNVGNGTNLFQAKRAPLSGGSVVPSSFIAGLVSTYTFTLQVADPILPGGFIIINIPSEVSFPDPQQAQCFNTSANFPSVPKCSFNATSIIMRFGFQALQRFTPEQGPLLFQVSGIQNPRSLRTSGSFQVFTYDSKGYMIDFKLDQLGVQMQQAQKLQLLEVVPSSQVVATTSAYLLTLTPTVPILAGDVISVTFPNDYITPLPYTLTTCHGVDVLAANLSCKSTGPNSLSLTVAFARVTSSAETLSFSIMSVVNPPSTTPTSLFATQIFDQ